MLPIDDIRRARLAELVAEEGSQAALARKIGKDKNQVNQWLGRRGARNLSAAVARDIEAKCLKPPGWMDHESDSQAVAFSRKSQPERPSFDKIADSIKLLRLVLELTGESDERVTDPGLLAIAYEVVDAAADGVTDSNVIDLTKRLAARLRERESVDGTKRGKAAGTGVTDGRPHRKAAGQA